MMAVAILLCGVYAYLLALKVGVLITLLIWLGGGLLSAVLLWVDEPRCLRKHHTYGEWILCAIAGPALLIPAISMFFEK